MSSSPNPLFDPSRSGNEFQSPVLTSRSSREENPAWTGWEVVALACVTVVSIFIFVAVVALVAHKFFYPRVPWAELTRFPSLVVLSQLLAYIWVLGLMYVMVKRDHEKDFLRAIRWNWPQHWPVYLLAGVVLSLGLQLFAHLLPIPKNLPMDQFFRTEREAYLLTFFGITFAPLMEELFFRGFMYPVLARQVGRAAGVVVTAVAFALLHGAQLMFSWGPVLVIFMVGLVLTLVRASTKSVAAGLLIHVAYNGTISLMMFAVTGGFRHLERLNQ